MSSFKHVGSIISKMWDEHPFRIIIVLAIILRLIAVVFSKGFGWFDDHFLIIEASQSWVDGFDYNNWLPASDGNTGPTGHNLFYTGIHYVIFKFFSFAGFTDPQSKMYIIRLLHAALSLLVIYFGYKITWKAGGRKAAKISALLLAVLWLFPFISVRNLVEFTCVPFLLWGTWILMNEEKHKDPFLRGLMAGLILGLAFAMRFQSLVYIGGIGLGLLILGRWKETLSLGVGLLFSSFILLAIIDIYIWGYPFAELAEYIHYNMYNYDEYIIGPWYQYLLVILLVFVPPVSLYLFFGFFYAFYKNRKKHLLIFLPSIIFLVFHSYYPNKQERFILPILPFIIILGTAGWYAFMSKSGFWKKRMSIYRSSWVFFWIVNIIVLLLITTTYSKRARVESMTYLSKYPGINLILVENTNRSGINLLPMYYLGQWATYIEVSNHSPASKISDWFIIHKDHNPDFYIFEGAVNLDARLTEIKEIFPDMEYEATIRPGMIDRILFWLNPVNENQNVYIYRNTHLHPSKIE